VPLLPILVLLPLAGAVLVGLTPKGAVGAQRALALLATLGTAVLGLWLCFDFDGTSAAASRLYDVPWFTLPGASGGVPIHVRLGLDGLSVLMVGLTALLGPVVVLSTHGHIEKRVKEFFVWLLVMQAAMLGVFLALDLILFYVFWEASLVPLYFIVGIWGGERRLYATIKFFLYTVAGSLVMMIAVIALVWRLGTADLGQLAEIAPALPLSVQGWMFAAFALAFAIKVPLFPFHTWLPDAHTEAPTSGSVVLAGVLLKMGTYGLVRFCIGLFPAATVVAAPWMMGLGAFGIVYGALLAMAQTDVKRLVVLGLFALTEAGLRGSMLQMVNHGLSTGLLFLLVGMIYERRHTRALDAFGGIAAVMPVFALLFVVAVLSSAGLPGLNGFAGEYLILLGAFQANPWFSAVSVLGVILGAVYLLIATRKLLFGPLTRKENKELADMNGRELVLALPVLALIVWIGVAPNPFLARTKGSVDALLGRVATARASLEAGQPAKTAASEPR
jgi:NADH-quinone oxidoreductase subunit M